MRQIAAACILLVIVALLSASLPQPAGAQEGTASSLQPRALPHVIDEAEFLTDDELARLESDLGRMHREGLPAFVSVRESTGHTDGDQQVANFYLGSEEIWEAMDAATGLVIVFSHNADDASWNISFAHEDGLLPVRGLQEQELATLGEPLTFEALGDGDIATGTLSVIRDAISEMAYTSPPVAPLSVAEQRAQSVLLFVAPVVALLLLALYAVGSFRPSLLPAAPATLNRQAFYHGGAFAVVMLLGVASVAARSTAGVGWTALLLLVIGAVFFLVPRVFRDPVDIPNSKQSDAEPQIRSRHWALDLSIVAGLFALSFGLNLHAVNHTDFHPDETRWLQRAYYIGDLREPFGETWGENNLSIGQPPLGSYLMGAGLLLQGKGLETNEVWDFVYGSDWNQLAGAVPSDEILEAGRRINAFVAALAVVAVYFVGRRLTNRVGGAIAGAFLALHPLHIWLGSQALSDQLLSLLIALTALVTLHLGARPSWRGAIMLGILLGLGGSVKLSPLLLSLPIAALGAFFLVRTKLLPRWFSEPRQDQRIGGMLVAQPLIAFLTFVISYPLLWPQPVRGTIDLFQMRTREMANQSSAWPGVTVDNPFEAIERVGTRLTEQWSTSGQLAGWINDALGTSLPTQGYDLLFIVPGILILAVMVLRQGLRSSPGLVAFYLSAQAAAILVGMRVDFYRYHLPLLLILAICLSVSAGALWSAYTAMRQRRSEMVDNRQETVVVSSSSSAEELEHTQ